MANQDKAGNKPAPRQTRTKPASQPTRLVRIGSANALVRGGYHGRYCDGYGGYCRYRY